MLIYLQKRQKLYTETETVGCSATAGCGAMIPLAYSFSLRICQERVRIVVNISGNVLLNSRLIASHCQSGQLYQCHLIGISEQSTLARLEYTNVPY